MIFFKGLERGDEGARISRRAQFHIYLVTEALGSVNRKIGYESLTVLGEKLMVISLVNEDYV